jgi:hypothetical protein
MTVHIEMITGFCPVQAEGTICGVPFYFRGRGRRWRMEIGADGAVEWECSCTWGTSKYAAGWMPEDEARRLIEWCAAEYARSRQISPVAPVLSSAAISDAANAERLLEPLLGPEAQT